ncbi:hypothetical protein DYP60_13785 [Sphaerochaeta halotolerans]|jgi:hypothetical protein|uniref:Uncharacterized protein n=1 Tax=Sphaerochaeta halotolerans TaxID=2293840 RepID=A0A372MCV2_9SPIR|nr:hypothetical protein DYP60_13785 [Sphaerochaeta halotolerans]
MRDIIAYSTVETLLEILLLILINIVPKKTISMNVDFLEVLPRKSCFQWPNSAVSVKKRDNPSWF